MEALSGPCPPAEVWLAGPGTWATLQGAEGQDASPEPGEGRAHTHLPCGMPPGRAACKVPLRLHQLWPCPHAGPGWIKTPGLWLRFRQQ